MGTGRVPSGAAGDAALVLVGVVAQNAVLFGLTVGLFWLGVFVARRLGGRAGYGLGALGVSRPKGGYGRAVRVGFVVGIGASAAGILVNATSMVVLDAFGVSTESNVQGPFLDGVRDWIQASPATAIAAAIAVIVLIGPAVEELVFRGAIFGGFLALASRLLGRRATGSGGEKPPGGGISFVLAAVLSSVVFALLHFEPVLLPALFLLAVALCALYRRTGSLLAPFVAHATFNSITVVALIVTALASPQPF